MVSLIKELLDWQQLSPTQFADRIGIGRPVISHILSERNKPSLEVIRSIKAAFPEVSTDWLLSGSGPMLATEAAAATPTTIAPAAETGPARVPADPASSPTSSLTEPGLAEAPVLAELPSPLGPPPPVAEAVPAQAPRLAPAEPLLAPLPAPARFRAGKPAAEATPQPAPTRVADAAPLVSPLAEAARVSAAGATSPALAAPVASGSVVPALAADTRPQPADLGAETAPMQPLVASHAATSEAATLAQHLAEPGKAIRRIVIFYRDGSFADYQPE